jgi:hypothetical protein
MRPLEVKPGGKESGTTLSPSGLPEFFVAFGLLLFFFIIMGAYLLITRQI